MKYRAIFLDMDHTLCDTQLADTLGLKDFQSELLLFLPKDTALKIGSKYLEVIYGKKKSDPFWQKQEAELESVFRARLLMQVLNEEAVDGLSWDSINQMADRFMALRVKHFDFFPGAIEMLSDLKRKYTLVLISNGPLYSQKPKIDKTAMHQYCDHVILGGELEKQKPHPSIFHLACQKAGCRPSEAIHVGDMLESDIQGAINAGIDNVLVGSRAEEVTGNIKPDHSIPIITKLKSLLEDIEAKYSCEINFM